MNKFFENLRENLWFFMILAMIAGLVKGIWAPMAFSRIICFSALLVMIYPVMIGLRIEDGLKLKGTGKALITSLLINFIISPIIAILLSKLFFPGNPYAAIGFYIFGFIPTSGMTMNWINSMKADMHTGLVLVSVNILATVVIVPFAIPFLITHTLDIGSFAINPMIILEKLGFVVVLPMILGWLTRVAFRAAKKEEVLYNSKLLLANIANLGLLYVLFLVMSLDSSQVILKNLDKLFQILIPVVLYYVVMFFIIQKYFTRAQGLPVLFSSILRYQVVALGIALASFGEGAYGPWVLLPIIIAFILQPTLASLLVKTYIPKLKFIA